MSFEQLDIQEQENKKKKKTLEQEKSQKFFEEKQLLDQSNELLQKLASEIAKEFGIDIAQAKELISNTTGSSLDHLKKSVSIPETIENTTLEKAILQARESLKNLSKKNRELFRQSLEQETYHPETYDYHFSKKFISPNLLEKAKNPQSLVDNVVGTGIGLIDSTEAIILFTYALGKGVLLTPYHLYLIITGKAEYKGWRKI